jgi:hypothetical protein
MTAPQKREISALQRDVLSLHPDRAATFTEVDAVICWMTFKCLDRETADEIVGSTKLDSDPEELLAAEVYLMRINRMSRDATRFGVREPAGLAP